MPGNSVTAPGYAPASSGILRGSGGVRKFKTRRNVARKGKLSHMPDVRLTDSHAIRTVIPPFDFDLEFEYTPRELLILTEKILLEDPKPANEYPAIFRPEKLRENARREIYCNAGIPEPHIVQGLYWRTHPNGRKYNDLQQRQTNPDARLSFYS